MDLHVDLVVGHVVALAFVLTAARARLGRHRARRRLVEAVGPDDVGDPVLDALERACEVVHADVHALLAGVLVVGGAADPVVAEHLGELQVTATGEGLTVGRLARRLDGAPTPALRAALVQRDVRIPGGARVTDRLARVVGDLEAVLGEPAQPDDRRNDDLLERLRLQAHEEVAVVLDGRERAALPLAVGVLAARDDAALKAAIGRAQTLTLVVEAVGRVAGAERPVVVAVGDVVAVVVDDAVLADGELARGRVGRRVGAVVLVGDEDDDQDRVGAQEDRTRILRGDFAAGVVGVGLPVAVRVDAADAELRGVRTAAGQRHPHRLEALLEAVTVGAEGGEAAELQLEVVLRALLGVRRPGALAPDVAVAAGLDHERQRAVRDELVAGDRVRRQRVAVFVAAVE